MQSRRHHTEKTAQRVAYQKDGRVVGAALGGSEISQLLHQMGPIVGDRVARIVPYFFNRFNLETTLTQLIKQDTIGAGGKAVAMGEDEGRAVHARG